MAAILRRHRRNNRHRLNWFLARMGGTTQPKRCPLDENTRQILVVRLNKRLGNILFLTPMLRSLAATLPAARIDVLIRNPAQAELLQTLPNIRTILIQPTSIRGALQAIRRLRKCRYDLVIDPMGNSASGRIAAALAATRQRMGFAREDQWLRLTHAAAAARNRHEALRGVELLQGAVSSPTITAHTTLAVYPDDTARTAAQRHWQQAFDGHQPSGPVIGFFRQATGHKELPRAWWQNWLEAVHQQLPDATVLEILPSPDTPPLAPNIAHIAIRPLTELAALMARLDQFVAADCGPMHLAAAAGVPVIGLFQATSGDNYAPLGRDCLCIDGDDLTPDVVARHLRNRLQHKPDDKQSHAPA